MNTEPAQQQTDLLQARTLFDQGRYAEAEKEIMRVLGSGTGSITAYLLLADARR